MEVPDPHTEARRFGEPYTSHHPVPNIKGYKEQIQHRNQNSSVPGTPSVQHTPPESPANTYFSEGENRERDSLTVDTDVNAPQSNDGTQDSAGGARKGDSSARNPMSATEMAEKSHEQSNASTEKEHRESSPEKGDKLRFREVTDPVTHLPVNIHDFTVKELGAVSTEHEAEARGKKLSDEDEVTWSQTRHDSMSALIEEELKQDQKTGGNGLWILQAASFILAGIFVNSAVEKVELNLDDRFGSLTTTFGRLAIKVILMITVGTFMNTILRRGSAGEKVPHARESKETDISRRQEAETAAWLNNTLASVWPLVNPDLFVCLGRGLSL